MEDILDKVARSRASKNKSGNGIFVLALAHHKVRALTRKPGTNFDTVNRKPR